VTDPIAATRAAYDGIAAEYARQWSTPPAWMNGELERLTGLLPAGARIADIGCGPGWHTQALRERGFAVTGFDLSHPMLTAAGVPGLVRADMRALPVAAGALDAVWCVAALLHVPRPEVPTVLVEFGRTLRSGGELLLSVAEGDGEGWDERAYGPSHRRWFVLHRYEALAGLLDAAGFDVVGHARESTHREWLRVHARRR
jgi:SAM-dependent methyltransferase